MHQGSALSPLLFVIVMEAISRKFRVALPWELLYADDLAVIAETEEDLTKRLSEWKDNEQGYDNWRMSDENAEGLQDGLVVYVVEVLVVLQHSALVVRSGYTRSVVVLYMAACTK